MRPRMSELKEGQLRTWIRPDHPRDVGKVILMMGRTGSEEEPIWSYVIDGRVDWHFEDVLLRDSEGVDGTA